MSKENVVFKPYKKHPEEWNVIPEQTRDDNGRKINCIEVGRTLTMNEEEVKEEDYLYEDIYENIISGIFVSKQAYSVEMTVSSEPKLIITYDDELVMHNDKISAYVNQILEYMPSLTNDMLIAALVEFNINRNAEQKFGAKLKKITADINKQYDTNYPVELIGYVLRQYFCEDKRNLEGQQEELHYYASYEELCQMVGKLFLAKSNNQTYAREKDLTEEILYRFIEGKLVEKR